MNLDEPLSEVKAPSMHSTPRLLDVVALLSDLPAHGLLRGRVGTVVDLLDGAYEIEFSDDERQTYAEVTLPADQFLVLYQRPQHAASRLRRFDLSDRDCRRLPHVRIAEDYVGLPRHILRFLEPRVAAVFGRHWRVVKKTTSIGNGAGQPTPVFRGRLRSALTGSSSRGWRSQERARDSARSRLFHGEDTERTVCRNRIADAARRPAVIALASVHDFGAGANWRYNERQNG